MAGFSWPFDPSAVEFLEGLGVHAYEIDRLARVRGDDVMGRPAAGDIARGTPLSRDLAGMP
jgi:hypothetical protein